MGKAYHSYVQRATPAAQKGRKAASAASLGTIAKYSTADDTRVRVDGLLQECGVDVNKSEQRRYRYFLQDVAADVLRKFDRKVEDAEGHVVVDRLASGAKKSKFKVCMCGRVSLNQDIARVHVTDKSACYKEMVTCGSVWTCPVCSSVVSVRRRNEIVAAAKGAKDQGLMVFLMTVTARHTAETDLQWFYNAMSAAHGRLWSGGDIKAIKMQFGIAGMISDREVTFSPENGAHPHIHELVFLRRPEMPKEQVEAIKAEIAESVLSVRSPKKRIEYYEERLERALRLAQVELEEPVVQAFDRVFRARWERVGYEAGLDMDEHGFDVANSSGRVAEYVAKFGHEPKWREADELTKWHRKTGKRGESYTPWQLLELISAGDEWAKEMFCAYALVYFGKKQVHWSKGLKKRFGIDEKTDEELAGEVSEEATLLYVVDVSMKDFRKHVLELRARGQYLELCELGDKETIAAAMFAAFGLRVMVYEAGTDDEEDSHEYAS